jgi:hypothetical protein
MNWGWEGLLTVEVDGRMMPCGSNTDPGLSALGVFTSALLHRGGMEVGG